MHTRGNFHTHTRTHKNPTKGSAIYELSTARTEKWNKIESRWERNKTWHWRRRWAVAWTRRSRQWRQRNLHRQQEYHPLTHNRRANWWFRGIPCRWRFNRGAWVSLELKKWSWNFNGERRKNGESESDLGNKGKKWWRVAVGKIDSSPLRHRVELTICRFGLFPCIGPYNYFNKIIGKRSLW